MIDALFDRQDVELRPDERVIFDLPLLKPEIVEIAYLLFHCELFRKEIAHTLQCLIFPHETHPGCRLLMPDTLILELHPTQPEFRNAVPGEIKQVVYRNTKVEAVGVFRQNGE